MQVLKFGGTSVASAKNITLVKDIIVQKKDAGSLIAVVSALGGITTQLVNASLLASSGDEGYLKLLNQVEQKHIKTVQELISVKAQSKTLGKVKILLNDLEDICRGVFLIQELTAKTSDKILSFGEKLSSTIIADFLNDSGINSSLAQPQEFIITDNNYGRANVDFGVTVPKISAYFGEQLPVYICPGFIASSKDNQWTTLGRGGSDYTAAILASALNAAELEIWTDVSGMMTADPRLVRSAYAINEISYEEAMELSHFGAKVIYPPTIQPALEKSIPIRIKNTFSKEDAGTLISANASANGQLIKGLSSIQNIALLNVSGSGMVGIPNFSHRLFRALSNAKVNVVLITQASSEHTICVGIDASDISKALTAIESEFAFELSARKINPVEVEKELAIIALVGANMKEQVGVSGNMFSVLGQNGVNIKAIAQGSSERNISVVVHEKEVKKALNSLHESFFLSDKRVINVFMIGVGNVGSALIEQLRKQKSYLSTHHHIDLRVVALANSRKMYFQERGMDLKEWKNKLEHESEPMSSELFLQKMAELNLRNSIFIDNTANADIASVYNGVLKESISVVTPNKIACTNSYEEYLNLKKTALKYKAKFLFETNVGAGLPVINTLNDLIKSGDEIIKIQAVLSGSLNFIFNNFNENTRFADIVRQAQEEGYTEPDPRIDLSGVDVKRKILILIRESGLNMEIDDIPSRAFIPKECMNAPTIEEFFKKLEEHEDTFQKMIADAKKAGKKIKYVATFNKGKAETGVQLIESSHPLYNLEGKDNIVLFTTKRYPEQPLVVKGAGAGAEVTASGIFADIMRIANAN
ncbi:bifunctional aspartate kinase/homoserine dehydrogenase I [Fulvivirga sediminis]|uniref:Bifunctional aspartate kinase/homoserine dehydrogenase I n=1 Tax=Fulvivirga sediminis TaxID=2803949 RepID=A0A937F1V3_9BACT|nr:bifunctional aspartate kinase/homoserine dehydrogenase I [Fulvivirga sediminis]MBL3654752.1 bifunctional aspartate kinase/homoserine dehydrogenase I [Fulvivirga sediminis]